VKAVVETNVIAYLLGTESFAVVTGGEDRTLRSRRT